MPDPSSNGNSRAARAIADLASIRAGLIELGPREKRKTLADIIDELDDTIRAKRALGYDDPWIALYLASRSDYAASTIVRALRGRNGRPKRRACKARKASA